MGDTSPDVIVADDLLTAPELVTIDDVAVVAVVTATAQGVPGPTGPTGPTGPPGADGLLSAATLAETITGTNTTKAVTPSGLAGSRPFFDVRNYGAKGDGSTDDTAAVQAAATAAAAKGGEVVFSGGTYLVGKVTCATKVALRGAGQGSTVLRCPVGTTGDWFTMSTYSEVSGLWFDANGQNVTALKMAAAARSMLHHLYFTGGGPTATAIHALGTSTGTASHGIHYAELNIIGYGGYGIILGDFAYDSELSQVWIGSCGVGLWAYTGAQQLTGVHIWGCTGDGLLLQDGTLSRITNCYFESNGGWGIHAVSGARGWWVSSSHIWANSLGGIYCESGQRTRITNCHISDNVGPGVKLNNHLNALIQTNHFYNYSTLVQTCAVQELGTTDRTLILGNFADNANHSGGVAFLIIGTGTVLFANYTAASARMLSLMPAMAGQPSNVAVDAPAGQNRGLAFRDDQARLRWLFRTDNAAESGANAGTGFQIVAYSDAGAFLNTPLSILRATGQVTIGNGLTIADGKDIFISGAVGTKFGTSATVKLAFYGATPIVRPTVPAAATDAATTQALANALRTALINLGLVS